MKPLSSPPSENIDRPGGERLASAQLHPPETARLVEIGGLVAGCTEKAGRVMPEEGQPHRRTWMAFAAAERIWGGSVTVERLEQWAAYRAFRESLAFRRASTAWSEDRKREWMLRRLRETGSQATLDRKARHLNMRHAFGVDPLRAAEVAGRAVLLVDDVMTSGASLHSAALALRQAGALRVSALVLARTDQPH